MAWIGEVVVRDRESVIHDIVNINLRRVEEFSYVLETFGLMVLLLPPGLDRFPIPFNHIEI